MVHFANSVLVSELFFSGFNEPSLRVVESENVRI